MFLIVYCILFRVFGTNVVEEIEDADADADDIGVMDPPGKLNTIWRITKTFKKLPFECNNVNVM